MWSRFTQVVAFTVCLWSLFGSEVHAQSEQSPPDVLAWTWTHILKLSDGTVILRYQRGDVSAYVARGPEGNLLSVHVRREGACILGRPEDGRLVYYPSTCHAFLSIDAGWRMAMRKQNASRT